MGVGLHELPAVVGSGPASAFWPCSTGTWLAQSGTLRAASALLVGQAGCRMP
jgi:hypothetical protein